MSKLLIIILFFFSSIVYGQKISVLPTDTIRRAFETKGAEGALSAFTYNYVPLYRVDTALSLSIANACTTSGEYNEKLNFLSEVGLHLKDEELTHTLLDYVKSYRDKYRSLNRIYLIESDLLFGLAYQSNLFAIESLKNEFLFWKSVGDSISKHLTDTTNEYSDIKQSFNRCRRNYFQIAWVLNKLGVPDFTVAYVSSLDTTSSFEKTRPRNRTADNAKWDTLNLMSNYSSLKDVDFQKEEEIQKLYQHFGVLDKDCWQKIIYKSNNGILYSGCWRSEREGWSTVFEMKLVAANKLMIRWVFGGIS